jgi:hypothetical protein
MDASENSQKISFEIVVKMNMGDSSAEDQQSYVKVLVRNVTTVLKSIINSFKYRLEAIERIYLVDGENYASVVYELQDAAGLKRGFAGESEDDQNLSVAKTISRFTDDGAVISSIVLLAPPYENMLTEVIEQAVPYEDWEASQQLFVHVAAQSVAQAHDALVRHRITKDADDEMLNSSDWWEISEYYAGVLTGEFLTAYYCGVFVSQKLLDFLSDGWKERYRQGIRNVVDQKRSIFGNIGNVASHNLWILMWEYSRYVGYRIANPELELPALDDLADDDEKAVFAELAEFLTSKISPDSPLPEGATIHPSQDPNSDLNKYVYDNLYPVWKKFGECLGVTFNDTPDDSGEYDDVFPETFSDSEDSDEEIQR